MNTSAKSGLFRAMHGLVLAKVLVLATLGFSGTANATRWTSVYYEMYSTSVQSVPPTQITNNTGEPITTDLQSIGVATVSAMASVGILKASVWNVSQVVSRPGGASDETASHASASFFDQTVFHADNPALDGTYGTLNANLLLDGNMLAVWNVERNNSVYYSAFATTVLQVSGTGITGFVTARESRGCGVSGCTNVSIPAPLSIPVQFTFVFGAVTNLQYNLFLDGNTSASFGFRECGNGYGSCGAMASSEITAAYSHNLIWGGISSITDAIGNPVADFTVSSDSGFNYALPATESATPEPSSLILFGTGGALLARSRFFKRKP